MSIAVPKRDKPTRTGACRSSAARHSMSVQADRQTDRQTQRETESICSKRTEVDTCLHRNLQGVHHWALENVCKASLPNAEACAYGTMAPQTPIQPARLQSTAERSGCSSAFANMQQCGEEFSTTRVSVVIKQIYRNYIWLRTTATKW